MSIESPESGKENLSEYQKEILDGVGAESIEELEVILKDLEGEEKRRRKRRRI